MSYGGVVGHHLPRVHPRAAVPIEPGDTLVLATDGIDPTKIGDVDRMASAQANADRIMADGRKGTDDALVLVARFRGGAS